MAGFVGYNLEARRPRPSSGASFFLTHWGLHASIDPVGQSVKPNFAASPSSRAAGWPTPSTHEEARPFFLGPKT